MQHGLTYVLFQVVDGDKYTDFEIKKKNGGVRLISAPIPQLKLLQSRLSGCLQDCLAEIEKTDCVKENCAISHGFHSGRSIFSNADVHKGRRWVFNLDLEDFFPSINFGRVRGYFIKNKNFFLDEDVATTIAQIACHNNSLPQGSPSSLVISNLLAHLLDMRISRIAKKARCSYTRYADDLTFSCSKKTFPGGIAVPSQVEERSLNWLPSDKLRHTIFSSGYKINQSKTRMQVYWSRQDATGRCCGRGLMRRSIILPTGCCASIRAGRKRTAITALAAVPRNLARWLLETFISLDETTVGQRRGF